MAECFDRRKDDASMQLFTHAEYVIEELGYDVDEDNLIVAEGVLHQHIDETGQRPTTWHFSQAIIDHKIIKK